MNYGCAAAIGAVSGLRSMSAPAIVAEAASRNIVSLKKTPLSWLASNAAGRTSALLALGELVADKLPFMPDRTDSPSLLWRAVSGAGCGYAICGSGRSKKGAWMSAFVGATAAVAASYAGLEFRRRVKLPPFAAALIEDAVALGSGSALIAAIGK
jgi:uncharacterized membrane protein